MREFNVCVSNYSEYLRSGVNKSIFIKLPCDNIEEEIAKIGVYLESVVPDAVEVDTVVNGCDLDLFKEYVDDFVWDDFQQSAAGRFFLKRGEK